MTKLLLLRLALSTLCALAVEDGHKVPLFTLRELEKNTARNRLEDVLTSTGLLALPLSSGKDRTAALSGLCRCAEAPQFQELRGADGVTLGDGQTVRQSLATATVGNSPLPLEEDLSKACGSDTALAMEALRDQVAEASQSFLKALDQLVGNPSQPILQNSYGGRYHSVSSIVHAASNLEHFHLYSKKQSGTNQLALQVHTDAGLFLAFVPAWNCQENSATDESFYLKDARGNLQRAIFPPNAVAIMLGAGAENWLNTRLPLKATRHAVQMESGTRRAWYGMSKCYVVDDFCLRLRSAAISRHFFQCISSRKAPLSKSIPAGIPLEK